MTDFKVCRRVPLGTKASIVGLLDQRSDHFYAAEEIYSVQNVIDHGSQAGMVYGPLHHVEVEPKTTVKKDRSGWLVTHLGQHHHRGTFEEALSLSLALIKGVQCSS